MQEWSLVELACQPEYTMEVTTLYILQLLLCESLK
jgi:hypothetical protein